MDQQHFAVAVAATCETLYQLLANAGHVGMCQMCAMAHQMTLVFVSTAESVWFDFSAA